MSTRHLHFTLPALLLAGALGCEEPPPAPAKPTYVDDVEPILRANCFSCHGATAGSFATFMQFRIKRWDVYNAKDPKYVELGFPESTDPNPDPEKRTKTFLGASEAVDGPTHFIVMKSYFTAADDFPLRMPPPPATRLSDRDIQVLENWEKNNFDQGKHPRNSKPTVKWISKPRVFEVVDDDGDQVLGNLVCEGNDTPILLGRKGGFALPMGATLPCRATLYDGFEEATADLTP